MEKLNSVRRETASTSSCSTRRRLRTRSISSTRQQAYRRDRLAGDALFVDQLEGSKGFSLFGRSAAYLLRGLAKFTGAEFLDLIGQFVTDLNELFGGFRVRAQAVYEDLRSKDVAFVIVTSPIPVAVGEAVFFSKKLADYGIHARGLIVNRVNHSSGVPSLEQLNADAAAVGTKLPSGPPSADLLQRIHTAALDIEALARRDAEGVRRLREHVSPDMSYTEVPEMRRDVHDLAALAEVGDYLLGARA